MGWGAVEVTGDPNDGDRHCEVQVWDGPYRMTCGLPRPCRKHEDAAFRRKYGVANRSAPARPDPPLDRMSRDGESYIGDGPYGA